MIKKAVIISGMDCPLTCVSCEFRRVLNRAKQIECSKTNSIGDFKELKSKKLPDCPIKPVQLSDGELKIMFKVKNKHDNKIYNVYNTDSVTSYGFTTILFLVYKNEWIWVDSSDYTPIDEVSNEN